MKTTGVLVTDIGEEQNKDKIIEAIDTQGRVKHGWEKHFTPEEWKTLGQENRENFEIKMLLSEMISDMSRCLVTNVVYELNTLEGTSLRCLRSKITFESFPKRSSS